MKFLVDMLNHAHWLRITFYCQQVQIDIITPQDVIVKRFDGIQPEAGFVSVKYQFPVAPAFGNWTVVASYGHEVRTSLVLFYLQFVIKVS